MRRKFYQWAIAAIALSPTFALAGEVEDKDAAKQIAAVLRDSGQMQGYKVGLKYQDGTVWLAGHVTSQEQMDACLKLVSDCEGVEQIVNDLSIAPSTSTSSKLRQPISMQAGMARPAGKQIAAAAPGQINLASATAAAPAAKPMGAAQPAGFQHHANRGYARVPNGPAGCPPGAMGGPGGPGGPGMGGPLPAYVPGAGGGPAPAAYDQAYMPNHAWPSYAAYPNFAAVTYPKQYSPSAWPFIGPFYPYPQVPLGWRRVSLEWDDGWWFLDFNDRGLH